MRPTIMALSSACKVCPLNKTCKKYSTSNPKVLGICQEAILWAGLTMAVAIEVSVLFFH